MFLTRILRRIFSGNRGSVSASYSAATPGTGDDITGLLPRLTRPAEDRLFNFFMPTFWEPRIQTR
jgi:hypothetical protein